MARLRKDDLPLTCLGQLPLSRVQLSCGLCFYSLLRPNSSTRWKNQDFWKVLGGVIPPVGGRNTPLALLRGLFAGGFFQWVEELGRRDDCLREDSSSDWKDWDVM